MTVIQTIDNEYPFLTGYSSNLQITGTAIKSWICSILARFGLFAWELSALHCPIDSENVDDILFFFHHIFFRLAGYEDSRKILNRFDFVPDCTIHMLATCPSDSHRYTMEKMLSGR